MRAAAASLDKAVAAHDQDLAVVDTLDLDAALLQSSVHITKAN